MVATGLNNSAMESGNRDLSGRNNFTNFPVLEFDLPRLGGFQKDWKDEDEDFEEVHGSTEEEEFIPGSPNEDLRNSSLLLEVDKKVEEYEYSEQANDNIFAQTVAFAWRVAIVTRAFSTFPPNLKLGNGNDHCCEVCKKHLLNDAAFRQGIRMVVENKEQLKAKFVEVLECLKRVKICEAEVIQGLAFFQAICKAHWQCSTFTLFLKNLKESFLACMIIALKCSTDSSLQNKVFANLCYQNCDRRCLTLLKNVESNILRFLDYEYPVSIITKKYNEFATVLGGRKIYFQAEENGFDGFDR